MSTGQPVEMGQTIRYPSTALLCVNSGDAEVFNRQTGERVDNNFPNRIDINKQTALTVGYMTRVSLTEVCMQWDTPNVNPLNNTITIFVTAGADATLRTVLDVGWYKPSELAQELEDQLNADWATFLNVTVTAPATLPWSVVVDPKTLQIEIIANSPDAPGDFDSFEFYIVPSNVNLTGFPKLQQDLTDMLGLTPSSAGADTFISIKGGYASYQYTPFVDVVSNLLTKNQNITDGDSSKRAVGSKLCRLYLANEDMENRTQDNIIGCRPFVFKREFSNPKQIQWNSTENIDVIDLSILDKYGNPIYIQPIYSETLAMSGDSATIGNTADFFFTVQITEN